MSASESRASPVQFASDNNSAICPEAWDALERANAGHAPAYGADDGQTRHVSGWMVDQIIDKFIEHHAA